jgi:hypothetical protein
MKTSSLAAALLAVAPAAATSWTWKEAEGKSINFTSVPGYFVQDDAATNPSGFDYVSNHPQLHSTPNLVSTRLTGLKGCRQLRPDQPDIPYRQAL